MKVIIKSAAVKYKINCCGWDVVMLKNDSFGISKLLKQIYFWGGLCTAVCFAFTLFFGFDIANLIGFAVGYGYMCLCYEYLGRTCVKCVSMDKKKACRSIKACYFIRYGGLFVLCAAGSFSSLATMSTILIPQFFPRLILTAGEFTKSHL